VTESRECVNLYPSISADGSRVVFASDCDLVAGGNTDENQEIYLAAIGPHGLRDVAATGAFRAAELEAALAGVGARRLHAGAYLNEFVVRVPDARAVHERLLNRGVLAGIPTAQLLPDEPALADGLLVCATEVTTSAEIEQFATALRAELAGVAVAGGAR
jgi:glycine cleavage system pyridoxal-binding protein P